MSRNQRPSGRGDDADLRAQNLATARAWLEEMERSPVYGELAAATRGEIPFACGVVAYYLTGRSLGRPVEHRAGDRALAEMDAADVSDLLLREFPYQVGAADLDGLVDAIIAFLIWAAKTGHVEREIEYTCRKLDRPAKEAFRSSPWSASKSLVMDAYRDGVDVSDVEAIRQHALGRGADARYVDAFLPPSSPISLGHGRWLYLDAWPAGGVAGSSR
jgi:hypothetical protein